MHHQGGRGESHALGGCLARCLPDLFAIGNVQANQAAGTMNESVPAVHRQGERHKKFTGWRVQFPHGSAGIRVQGDHVTEFDRHRFTAALQAGAFSGNFGATDHQV